MKLQDIKDMERYLYEDCYKKGEIYDADGYFYQVFHEEDDCIILGEIKNKNNVFREDLDIEAVIAKSQNNKNHYASILLITRIKDKKRIQDVIKIDATINNLKMIKQLINNNYTDLSINDFLRKDEKLDIEQIFEIFKEI